MTNIAEVVNKVSTISIIDFTYERKFKQRRRLGLSQAGHTCQRFLWYKHRGFDEPVPDGRVLRLFKMGEAVEELVASDLMEAGFEVFDRQAPVEFTMDGITLTGSIDGVITGLMESKGPHLWECKSMGAKSFAKLLKMGYEAYSGLYHDTYKGQIHLYMIGRELKKAFVTVYNKDTSELYQEIIEVKEDWAIGKLQDAFKAIAQESPPERHCPDADNFEAKWCPFYSECWGLSL